MLVLTHIRNVLKANSQRQVLVRNIGVAARSLEQGYYYYWNLVCCSGSVNQEGLQVSEIYHQRQRKMTRYNQEFISSPTRPNVLAPRCRIPEENQEVPDCSQSIDRIAIMPCHRMSLYGIGLSIRQIHHSGIDCHRRKHPECQVARP